ncbi:MAG: hypothetical protein P1P88_14620 [Bacteroidales bacterium]|nr:hypothetical protein [Bacteroidales bacterium]
MMTIFINGGGYSIKATISFIIDGGCFIKGGSYFLLGVGCFRLMVAISGKDTFKFQN